MSSEYAMESVVRGHHIYKASWDPYVGEVLVLEREVANVHDVHAVAIMKEDGVVGHVPKELSRIFWHFIWHGGTITCEVTGHRKFGRGLEVPCKYTFTGAPKNIKKLEILFAGKKSAS